MRKYTLASKDAKAKVDLRDYQQIIEDAIHEVLPTAVVRVESDYYTVQPSPEQWAAIRIGRAICKSALKKYCITVTVPKLFGSIELQEERIDENREK